MHYTIPIISITIGTINYLYWRKKGYSNLGILFFGIIVSFVLMAMLSKYLSK